MTDPLKARLECEHGQMENHLLSTPTWNHSVMGQMPKETKACPGGREVLLVPTDDIDTERIIAESVARYVETVGDAVDAAVQARKRLKAAVGTTWSIKDINDVPL